MLLFRSEHEVDQWCHARKRQRGAVFSLQVGWRLAEAWAQNRLHPNWRERDHTEMTALLESLGLTGDFWRLP
jgi:hypothetical protein